jgi:hypothetical protein
MTAPIRTAPRIPYTRIAASKRGDSRSGCVCRLEVRGTVLRPYSGYIRCRKEACPSRWQVAAEHVPHRAACGATHMARQDAPSEAGMLLTSSSVIDPSKRIISTSCRINSEPKSVGWNASAIANGPTSKACGRRSAGTTQKQRQRGPSSTANEKQALLAVNGGGQVCHLQRAPA